MIMRKHLFLAIAATCLLTTFLIGIVPIQSQTASPYDPWLDYNDDGKIDGRDLLAMSRAFVSYGDPTKNVVVKDDFQELSPGFVIIPPEGSYYYELNLTGKRQYELWMMANQTLNVDLLTYIGPNTVALDRFYYNSSQAAIHAWEVRTYTASTGRAGFVFSNFNDQIANLFLDVYLHSIPVAAFNPPVP